MRNNYEQSEFYCTRCGHKGLPVQRNKGQKRERGHLKKLYCIYCGYETNHAEIQPDARYTYDDFKLEFNYHNFDENGNRIYTLNQLKEMIENGTEKK